MDVVTEAQNRWKKIGLAVSFATMVSEDAAATHVSNLISYIETSEDPAAPILRAIQDGSDQQKFVVHLQQRITNHDKDIERMCNFHYQGFVDSVGELLKVRAYAEKLKEEVLETNESLQRSGQPVLQQANELQRARKVLLNIAATTEHLQTCLPVLQVYCKLNDQINSKRYYPALKTLEQLEHTYLPRVRRYRFCEKIAQNIPKIRNSIKEASMSDLTDFLESIRKHSDMIGEEAMIQVQKRTALETSAPPIRKHRNSKADNSLTEVDKDSLEDGFAEEEEEEEVLAQDKVDFSPVYRCLHIYTVLGEKEVFEMHYRRERTKQCKLTIIPQGRDVDRAEFYQKYFYQVVGFFVVEDHIHNTTDGLASSEYMEKLWNVALSKINETLTDKTALCTDASLLLQIKDQIVLFLRTLTSYGFNTTAISDLLVILKDQYNEILMKTWLNIFSTIFDEDNYTAISVNTKEEFEQNIKDFPFTDDALRKAPCPKELPFSQFVPRVYHQIKEFIYACHKFSLELNLTDTERDDMIRKSTNILLTRTLSGCLLALIRRHSLGLAELVQVIINTTQLENACDYLEDFISNITGTQGDNIHAARLQGAGIFRDASSEAAQEIYKRLNYKMDQFLDLSSYDWSMEDSHGKASDYILDIISFLEGSFKAFTNIPQKVAITACMSTCKHLATSLMNFLLDEGQCYISMGALRQFSLDVIQCEVFVNSEPVPGFKDGTLQMTFVELRQLLDLFIEWDWPTYLAEYNHSNRQYYRVTPQTAIILLEKMREPDKKKNLFTTFKKNERDRKKLMDTVLKQLRALTTRPAGGN